MRNRKSSWTCGSHRSASPPVWIVRSTRGRADGNQLRNGGCKISCCVICSSEESLGPRLTPGTRSSSGKSGSCGSNASTAVSRINDTSSIAISSHEANRLRGSAVHVPVPVCTDVHQSECAPATHRHQVSDCNDWSVNACDLEIDVDAGHGEVLLFSLCFFMSVAPVATRNGVAPRVGLVVVSVQDCGGHDKSAAPLSVEDLLLLSTPIVSQ